MNPQENFTITGKAINAKYSAAIISENGDLYYIPQRSSWSDDVVGTVVTVTGTLHREGHEPSTINPNEPQSQEINGYFYTIVDHRLQG